MIAICWLEDSPSTEREIVQHTHQLAAQRFLREYVDETDSDLELASVCVRDRDGGATYVFCVHVELVPVYRATLVGKL